MSRVPETEAATFDIRVAEAADAARLSVLMRDTFFAANGHASTPENIAAFLAATYHAERQREEILDPDILTLVVEAPASGTWAGFAQVRFATPPPPEVVLARPVELGRLYLSQAFHGQGLAAPLMQRIVAEARARGGDGLWLKVWQEAPQAQRFYGKHGFRIVGRAVFVVGDDPKDDWVMVRELPGREVTGLLQWDGDIAQFLPVGEFRFRPLAALVTNAITEVRARGLRDLLVDITGARGLAPPSLGERHGMVRDWAEAAQGKVRLAIVVPPEFIDAQRFGVVAAANFGLVGNVFEGRDEALAWLRDSRG